MMRNYSLAALAILALAGSAHAQDSLQNGSTAVAQSGAAGSAIVGGTLATGSVVAGSGVMAAGASAMAVGGSTAAAGSQIGKDADAASRFASGPLPVDKTVVVTPQDAPKVPYDAQTPAPKAPSTRGF